MLVSQQCRNDIADLSTKDRYSYYPNPYNFLCKIAEVLQKHGLTTNTFEIYCYNMEGNGFISIIKNDLDIGRIYYSYYRMPSYNWEFVTYVTQEGNLYNEYFSLSPYTMQ